MADDIDLAQEINERHLEAALAKHSGTRPTSESLNDCEDCGTPIPERRRVAQPGCTRCIPCQTTFELLANWRN